MIPELFPSVEPFIRRALSGESVLGVEMTKPASGANAGSTILLSYEPAFDEAGEVVGVSVALSDITSLRKSEQARRETEEHFRHLMELISADPLGGRSQGRALDVSQRWLDLTGMTDDQWRGFGWLDALHPDDRQPTLDTVRRAARTGEPIDVTYRVRRRPTASGSTCARAGPRASATTAGSSAGTARWKCWKQRCPRSRSMPRGVTLKNENSRKIA